MTDTVLAGRVGRLASRETAAERRTVVRVTGEGDMSVAADWLERTYQGDVFFASAAAVTVPVVANNLVSVFGIYNPPGSGKLLVMIDTDLAVVNATTVVNGYGWYSSTATLSAAATFTTQGTYRTRRMQDATNSGVARFYSAVTHSGTPSLEALITTHGATTNTQPLPGRNFNGSLIIPPGILASVAATTAAGTGSGLTVSATWAEVPA